ncbi:helix-turn-helix domain-containing protein [Aerosakkonemataceae cyanobacterium BLCC-F50]|uniref:Helix-turn-helix domain-containing protein n=1 Tax=Floridaenema flaviceps BLCC-F50 TaxID=3153642 RepID=A0ABV4XVC1_9CYAN
MVKKRNQNGEADPPLKRLRDELEMSQEEFGRIIGISARTVSRWEAGDSTPTFTISQMKALVRLLESKGKSIYDLPDNFSVKPDLAINGN